MSDVLILGGTGKTGRRLAHELRAAGVPARTAARSGADVAFDWDDAGTRRAAVAGADRVYLVPPALRLDHPPLVAAFLDEAAAAGVRHVTFLSAFGVDRAPDGTPLRAVELLLAGRDDVTHSVVRPAWFMENLSEGAFGPAVAEGVLALPAGDGAEAFVAAQDIAAVAAATLRDPAAHAGAAYDVTGPEALTHAQVAGVLTGVLGREVRFEDVPADAWVRGAVAAGLPADYAGLLAGLLDVIRQGHGSRPTDAVQRVAGRRPKAFADWAREAFGSRVAA